jgi:hydrophobic/amphiphilic exporter-1 (mainly G- bacteria), HAE1 family
MNLAALSIKRPIFIICIVSLMLVLGGIAMKKMSVDLFPDVTFPTIFIQNFYPGASPQDMEKLVSKIIEDEMGSLSGLDKLYSQNADGISYVTLMFKIGTDVKDAEQQIRQRLGNVRSKLPSDMKEPIVRRFDPADQAVVQLAVTGKMSPDQIYDIVDQKVKTQFETIPGVGLVNIIGGRKREIQVLVNKDKLQDRRLSVIQISEKIRNTSRDVPVGKLENSKNEITVRASGEFESIDAIRKVNINFLGSDQGVALDSVAEVREGLEQEQSAFAFRSRGKDFLREDSISLSIYKQSGANTVKIVDLVQAKIEKVNDLLKALNIDAKVNLVRENSRPIRLNIADVSESILIGIVLCILVVFFFLGSVKSTLITGLALPNSLLGGFVIMYAMGFTINILTLLALSLAVGLLIDDAIVVRENIFRHIEMGKSPMQASLDGTKEVSLAVIATTLVVISVFGPIAFLDGIIGQFFKQFGLTVVFTMLISLFDAFTMAPMLSTYLATSADHHRGQGFLDRALNQFDRFQHWLEHHYVNLIEWVLQNRLKVLGSALVIFVASLIAGSVIPKNFLPPADNGEFQVSVELPLGTSLERTKNYVLGVEDEIVKNPGVELISTVSGYSTRPEANKANIYVRLVPRKQRNGNTTAMKTQVREALEKFQKESLIQVGDVDISGGGQKVMQLSIRGEDLDELSGYVEKLKPRLQKIQGLIDVDTNYRTGKPEYQVVFDRKRAESLGVSTATAGAELRARLEGDVPAVYRVNGNEYDIRVRLREEDRDIREQFNSTRVPNVNFNMIPLAKVAEGKEVKSYSAINRLNKGRYIMIDANLGPGGNLGNATVEIEKILNSDPELKIPSSLSYEFIGQADDFKVLIQNMLIAIGLGVLLIYFVLSSLYESFITPLTILLALPLAITGAFGALLITGKSIDLFSMIGIVMLLGVVAKNSILLVDYANQQMEAGMERTKAILAACSARLRPILMTSFALIGGTIPIAIGLNEASAQRTSMGVAIIGGLISSTVLTLIVVPAAFGYIDDLRRWINRKLKFGASMNEAGKISVEKPLH